MSDRVSAEVRDVDVEEQVSPRASPPAGPSHRPPAASSSNVGMTRFPAGSVPFIPLPDGYRIEVRRSVYLADRKGRNRLQDVYLSGAILNDTGSEFHIQWDKPPDPTSPTDHLEWLHQMWRPMNNVKAFPDLHRCTCRKRITHSQGRHHRLCGLATDVRIPVPDGTRIRILCHHEEGSDDWYAGVVSQDDGLSFHMRWDVDAPAELLTWKRERWEYEDRALLAPAVVRDAERTEWAAPSTPRLEEPREAAETTLDLDDFIVKRSIRSVRFIPKGVAPAVSRALTDIFAAITAGAPNAWHKYVLFTVTVLRTVPRDVPFPPVITNRLKLWEAGNTAALLKELYDQVPEDSPRIDGVQDHRPAAPAISAARIGNPGKALQCLTSSSLAPPTEETRLALSSLHPPRQQLADILAPDPVLSESTYQAPTFDEDTVLRAVRSFPAGTGGGPLGLQPDLLKWLLTKDPSGNLLRSLTGLINYLVDGKGDAFARRFIAGANLFGILKSPKPGDIRPIACGELLRRLVGKCMRRVLLDAIPRGNQFGTAKLGSERIVHMLRHRVASERFDKAAIGVLCVDIRNAFNTISRDVMLLQVKSKCPAAYRWVSWLYAEGSSLLLSGGLAPLPSEEGVQQGDPLGPLLFALTIAPLIQTILDRVPTLDLNLWYLDDGTLVGSESNLARAWEVIQEEAPRYGLILNSSKCFVVSDFAGPFLHSAEFPTDKAERERFLRSHPDLIERKRYDDWVVLGVPMGDAECVARHVHNSILAKMKKACEALVDLEDPQVSYYILKSCLSFCRGVYFARTVPPDLARPWLTRMDDLVEHTFLRIAGISPGELEDFQWTQLRLPHRFGGLGLSPTHLMCEAAYMCSARMAASLDRWDPTSHPGFTEATGALTTTLDTSCPDLRTASQHDLSEALFEKAFHNTASELVASMAAADSVEHSTLHYLRLLSQAAPDTTMWLQAVPNRFYNQDQPPLFFITNIRLWLGLPLCPDDPFGNKVLSVRGGHGVRHNKIRDAIMRVLQSAAGVAARLEVRLSPYSQERGGDIVVGGVAVDLAVTSPLQPLYTSRMRAGNALPTRPYAVEEYATDVKQERYQDQARQAGYEFFPMVLDQYGAMNSDGVAALRKMAEIAHLPLQLPISTVLRRLRMAVSCELARQNAALLLQRYACDTSCGMLNFPEDPGPWPG